MRVHTTLQHNTLSCVLLSLMYKHLAVQIIKILLKSLEIETTLLTFDLLKILKTVSFIFTQFLSDLIEHFMKDQQFKALYHLATYHSSVPNRTLIPVKQEPHLGTVECLGPFKYLCF